MLTIEQKEQFNEVLETLGGNLDISETQFNAAVTSYESVGTWLSKDDSELAPYNPTIKPQGSFILGTIIKPISVDDDLDIDLVCELSKKNDSWTQFDLKKIVGDQLKANKRIDDLLDEEGRRCWTLKYRQESDNLKEKYHMDILPAITSEGYNVILNESYAKAFSAEEVDKLGISITDNKSDNYYSSNTPEDWHKSNPFGYAQWFFAKASLQQTTKLFSLNESVKPVPTFQKERFPLQRVVQILKRHRDMFYKGKSEEERKNKPISIIITTLASHAYRGEVNIMDALGNVISTMYENIKDYNPNTGEKEKWVENPVNSLENFADKWKEFPERQTHFYNWLNEIKKDLSNITSQAERGLSFINEAMNRPFGEELMTKTFSNIKNKGLLSSTSTFLSANVNKSIDTELPKKLPKTKREGFQK
ncbi:cyclic GMP-AMP synthase DncV-like nucleotidyltransferase [Flavivirga jejuensis]|uniref:Cyclic GMP-AMP synthase n=1 Tax=Flavivirga jejuensis TaxID=870487 RepID=A0ABT8WL34_9FLAO|nr:nucleotidyltransferase [Flavivirga jejuensis]MDO5973867.1 nucleotidyltransferase [Flavivirga jejuensis]